MRRVYPLLFLVALAPLLAHSQVLSDSLIRRGTLQNCIRYALEHQPSMQQTPLDEEITGSAIQGKLADWFPQFNFNFTVQHNPQLPVAIVQGTPVRQGMANASNVQFSFSQTLCPTQQGGSTVRDLLSSGISNVYTIERGGIKKLIYQSPWYENGKYAGLVELSLPIPMQMPHFVRDKR